MGVPIWWVLGVALSQNPGWPAPDPQLEPEALAASARQPGDPDFERSCDGQWPLYSFTPTCAVALTDDIRALGTGVHIDRAWLLTTGDPAVRIGVLDTGADFRDRELVGRWALNPGELPAPDLGTGPAKHDQNGDGAFTVLDYTSATSTAPPTVQTVRDVRLLERSDRGDVNGNGLLDPQDLILLFSDDADDDGNGRIDDICGWDFVGQDNDPTDPDPTRHGSAQARIAVAETNNAFGGAGVCPHCLAVPFRVATRNIAPLTPLSEAIRFGSESQIAVLAIGVPPTTDVGPTEGPLQGALQQAQRQGTLVVAPPGQTSGVHQPTPWPADLALVTTSIGVDTDGLDLATTTFSPDPCSSFGAQAALSAPGRCDEAPTALTAGIAGLVLSAARGAPVVNVPALDPPLSPIELRAVLEATATPPPVVGAETPSWDPRSGYGRINARQAIDAVLRRDIPPEAELLEPESYAVVDSTQATPMIIEARINNRRHAEISWVLDFATGLAPRNESFTTVASGTLSEQVSETIQGEVPLTGLFRDTTAPPLSATQPALTIRLRVSASGAGATLTNEVRRIVFVHRDLYLFPAFPIALPGAVSSSPRVLDIDSDGTEEIVVPTNSGEIHALEATGESVRGWPIELPDTRSSASPRPSEPPSIVGALATAPTEDGVGYRFALTTEDGALIVLTTSSGGNRFWVRRARTSTSGEDFSQHMLTGPVLADLDGNGQLDVLVTTANGVLDAFTIEGSPRAGFPVRHDEPISAPAVGDLDGNGTTEIVIATADRLFVRDAMGALLDGWPVSIEGPVAGLISQPRAYGAPVAAPAAPVIADVDGDGTAEILWGPFGRAPLVFGIGGTLRRPTSSARGGFSQLADAQPQGPDVFAAGGASAAADLDQDGLIDLIHAVAPVPFLRGDGAIRREAFEPLIGAWSTITGDFIPGFPVGSSDRFRGGPIVVDVDGDGRPEVVFGDGQYRLQASSSAGVSPRGWPKATGGAIAGSPTVGDLDGDGRLEIIAVNTQGLLFAWRTEADASLPVPWEGARHDHASTGNVATPTTVRVPAADDEGCDCTTRARPTLLQDELHFTVFVALLALRRRRK